MALPEPCVSDLALSNEDHGSSVRAAARWMITAFAAIGALLVAGLQLQALGEIEDDRWLAAALASALLALVATGSVIVFASYVLVAPSLTWDDLIRRETTAMIALAQASGVQAPSAATDLDDLLRELVAATEMRAAPLASPRDLRQDLAAARQALAQNPSDDARQVRVQQIEETAAVCLHHANAWQSRYRYKILIRVLIPAGLLIAGCVVIFAWASHPPDKAPKVTKPISVSVYLLEQPEEGARSEITASCAGKRLEGTAVAGTLSEPEVVTKPQPGCPAQRFTVTSSLGVAISAK
ncbi:hypothetical protein ACFWZT_31020 [Streptomyces alboflavus]|uniref:hypothetical protein n=1 Tax=Streptomyces alboflavus TaxID=67267 RepID=UPI0036AEC9B8